MHIVHKDPVTSSPTLRTGVVIVVTLSYSLPNPPSLRPYLIDLESTNGTYINNQRIESARYWELKEQVSNPASQYILWPLHNYSYHLSALSHPFGNCHFHVGQYA